MRVYGLTYHDYDDYTVEGLFTTQGLAEQARDWLIEHRANHWREIIEAGQKERDANPRKGYPGRLPTPAEAEQWEREKQQSCLHIETFDVESDLIGWKVEQQK